MEARTPGDARKRIEDEIAGTLGTISFPTDKEQSGLLVVRSNQIIAFRLSPYADTTPAKRGEADQGKPV